MKINTRQSLKSGLKINEKLSSPCVKDNRKCNLNANAASPKKGYFKKLLRTKNLNNCDNQSLLIKKDPKLKQNCVVVLEKINFHDLESKLKINLNNFKISDFESNLGLRRKTTRIPIKMNLRKTSINRTVLKKKHYLSSNSPLKKALKGNVSRNTPKIRNNLSLDSSSYLRSGLRGLRSKSKIDTGIPKKNFQISQIPKKDISLVAAEKHQITSSKETKVCDLTNARTSLRLRNVCKNIPQEISPRKKSYTYNLNKDPTLELKNDRESISPVKKVLSQENKLSEKAGHSKHQHKESPSKSCRNYEKNSISQKENIKEKVLIQILSPQGAINLEVLSTESSRGKSNQFKLGERKSTRHSKFLKEKSNLVGLSNASVKSDNESENSYSNLGIKSIPSPIPSKQTRSVSNKKNQSPRKVIVSNKVKTKRKDSRKISSGKIENNLSKLDVSNYSPTQSDPVDENSPRFFNTNIQHEKKQRILRSSRKSLIEQHICYLSKNESLLENTVNEQMNSSMSQSPNSALLLHIKTPERTILKEVKHDKSDPLHDRSVLKEIKHRKVSELSSPSPLKNQICKNSNVNDKCDLLLTNDKVTKPNLRLSSKRPSQEILKKQNQRNSDVDKCDSLLSNDKATKAELNLTEKRMSREATKRQKHENSSIEYKTPVKKQKHDKLNFVGDKCFLSNEKVTKPNNKTLINGQKQVTSDIFDKCDLLLSNDKGKKPKLKTLVKSQKHNDIDLVNGECDLLLSNDKIKRPKPKFHSSHVKDSLVKPQKKRSKSEGHIRKQDMKKKKNLLTPNILVKEDKPKDKNSNADNICILSNSKQPTKGTMKRKQWFVEKLNKQSEGHEDDIFEAKEFEIAEGLFGEDSDSSELYQHMLTPKREFTLVPQNGKTPAYDPCPSPVDICATTRKEADEYLYRRIKRQKNKVSEQKQNPVMQTFEEKQAELDIEKILQDVKKLNKPKKRKRESESIEEDEDFYFSDVSEDSAGSFIID